MFAVVCRFLGHFDLTLAFVAVEKKLLKDKIGYGSVTVDAFNSQSVKYRRRKDQLMKVKKIGGIFG